MRLDRSDFSCKLLGLGTARSSQLVFGTSRRLLRVSSHKHERRGCGDGCKSNFHTFLGPTVHHAVCNCRDESVRSTSFRSGKEGDERGQQTSYQLQHLVARCLSSHVGNIFILHSVCFFLLLRASQ